MTRVLFVCLGNICRSPMAEVLFQEHVKKAGLANDIETDSAGTGAWHIGEPPHVGTQKKLAEKGLNTEGMRGRKLTEQDLKDFQYVIAMDAENLGEIHRMAGYDCDAYTARLLDFVEESEFADVPDPFFTGDFDTVYDLVNEGCRRLLAFIRERENL
ncbi:MAG TPA: low molecular weight protein-tyrosine-phosphatase [Bacillales bacterium]|nr:low molecular weight protein-tyrosine-phosphatase [Bacillales bacterium]